MAHSDVALVRARYNFACGYCGVSETETGGELTVNHFHPQSEGGDDSPDNLVYACFRCNLHKSDFAPTPAQTANGERLLHPLLDDVSLHLVEDAARLVPLTPTGAFHISTLHLNRPALVRHRLAREEAALWREETHLLREETAQQQQQIAIQEAFIRLLLELLEE